MRLLAYGESLTGWHLHLRILLIMSGTSYRLIALGASDDITNTSVAEVSFEAAWGKILDGQPLICAKTGSQFDPVPVRPSAALLDVSHFYHEYQW